MNLVVAYACNEAYMEQTVVSMTSLFENNKCFEKITVFFINMGISKESKLTLYQLAQKYERDIEIIEFQSIAYDLNIKDTGRHIASVYAKIFFGRLPVEDKILYLDSDTIIADSLESLWRMDISDYYCAGVETIHTIQENEVFGLTKSEKAINDGVVLMNLKLWRSEEVLERCLRFIDEYGGQPPVLSEGTINNVCKNKILFISPKYNLLTSIVDNHSTKKIETYTGRNYYSQEVIDDAINKPCIIHFLCGFYNRPWCKQCYHPMKEQYLFYRKKTAWKDTPLSDKKMDKRTRMIGILYHCLPISIFLKIQKLYNSGLLIERKSD